jgi:hypothetical protein
MHTSFLVGGDQESKLRQFVQFVGLPADAVRFMRSENWEQILAGVNTRDRRPLVIELGSGMDYPPPQAWLEIPSCDGGDRDIFFFGAGSTGSDQNPEPSSPSETPRQDRVNIPAASEIRFSDDALWGPLQSLRANWPLSPESLPTTSLKLSGACETLITIKDQPWFFLNRSDGPTVFVWAAAHLPDISEPINSADEEQAQHLLWLLPLLAFLRHAFGKRTWHAPTCLANFIIDDPPVRGRYGSFEPARHLASLIDIPHATTVAFIPWYWSRSTALAAELFRNHSSELSLCVHGCDHTDGEFASFNRVTLTGKCQLALQRSQLLRERTGLSCEPVMVFPQGLFSKAAVTALRETSFLGAVNSTLLPVDAQVGDVRLADLMEPAYTSIEDFPIFLRRYPRDPVLCAVDLFLGRPLLVVEHQDYFRHGYGDCRRFFEAVNSLRCSLSWAPLDQIVRRACLQREIEPGTIEVRFYSNSFVLENPSAQRWSYRLVRRCNRPELIRGVLVNGSPVAHAFKDGEVTFALELHPRTSATVQLVKNGLGANEVFKGSVSYRGRVWARRRLCELRDNHLWIWLCARWIKRALHRGSSSA